MKHTAFPIMLTRGVDGDDIRKELDKYSVNYGVVQCFSVDVIGYLNAHGATLGSIAAAIAFPLCAWIKGRANRSIKIRLKDGTVVEAKGMSPQQIADHLKVAVQATLQEDEEI